MRRKRIIVSLFIMIAIITLFVINSTLAATGVSIANKTVDLNNTVTITVVMPNGAVGYSGTISYDSSKLEYISGADNVVSIGTLRVAKANMDLRTG